MLGAVAFIVFLGISGLVFRLKRQKRRRPR